MNPTLEVKTKVEVDKTMKLIDMNYLNRICAKLDMNTPVDLTKQEKLDKGKQRGNRNSVQ